MHLTNHFTTWSQFACQIELCFGPTIFINHEEKLFKIKRSLTVANIVSDQDPVFMSLFWCELLKIQGKVLGMRSIYNP